MFPDVELILPVKDGATWEYTAGSNLRRKCNVGIVDSLTVKTGTFREVAKRTCNVYEGKKKKMKRIPAFEQITYFAPNVGMIKKTTGDHKSACYELVGYDIK